MSKKILAPVLLQKFMFDFRFVSLAAILIFFATFSVFAQSPVPTPPEDVPEKIFTEEIGLNVSILDTAGKFVSDVKKEDLVIVENGRIHQVSSVRRVPANVLIVLDSGGEVRYAKNANVTREAAKILVRSLRIEDKIAVMQYHDKIEPIGALTDDKSKILNTLDTKIGFGRKSIFFRALDEAVQSFTKIAQGNRHLVLITDGTDSFDDLKEKEKAVKSFLSSDLNIHVLSYTYLQQFVINPKKAIRQNGEPAPTRLPEAGLIGLPDPKFIGGEKIVTPRRIAKLPRLSSVNTDGEMRRKQQEQSKKLEDGEQFLLSVAEDTNGIFYLPRTYEEMFENSAALAHIIDSQYVVTYLPKNLVSETRKDEIRLIEVVSKRQGLNLHGKRKLLVTNK